MGYSEPALRPRSSKRERTLSWVLLVLFLPLYGISLLVSGLAFSSALFGHGGLSAREAHNDMIVAKCLALLALSVLLASIIVGFRARRDSWKEIWWVPLGTVILGLVLYGEIAFTLQWF